METPYLPTTEPKPRTFWRDVGVAVVATIIAAPILSALAWFVSDDAEGYLSYSWNLLKWLVAGYWPLLVGGACLAKSTSTWVQCKLMVKEWRAVLAESEGKAQMRSRLEPARSALANAQDFHNAANIHLKVEKKSAEWLHGIKELRASWDEWVVRSVTPLLTRAQRIEFEGQSKPISDPGDPGQYQFGKNFMAITSRGGITPEARMRGVASGVRYLRAELLREYPELAGAPMRSR